MYEVYDNMGITELVTLHKYLSKKIEKFKTQTKNKYNKIMESALSEDSIERAEAKSILNAMQAEFPFISYRPQFSVVPFSEQKKREIIKNLIDTGRYKITDIMTEKVFIEPQLKDLKSLEKALTEKDYKDHVNPEVKKKYTGVSIYFKEVK